MPASSAIDLSLLPAPAVVETLNFETIFAQMVALVQTGVPGVFDGVPDFDGSIESDPAVKILQVAAYCRMLDRARVNAGARACMVAYSTGADLTNLGALLLVERLEDESDDAYRERIVIAPDGFSVAGPEAAYIFHARSASASVRDAQPISPAPGEIVVYVLADTDTGEAGAPLLALVEAALSAQTVRPMGDSVSVESVAVIDYDVEATIKTFPGPDAEVVLANAIAARDAYISAMRKIKRDVTRAGLIAAHFVAGVQNVNLVSPAADVVCSDGEVAHCTARETTLDGLGE